jgi:hypothetical protein
MRQCANLACEISRDRLSQCLRPRPAIGDKLQINVDAGQPAQAADLSQAPPCGRARIELVDSEAVLGCKLIEQLLDFTAASAMARQHQYAHLPISSNI